MLKYKTKVIDYHSLKTKIPEDRVLTNYIYNNFDFVIIDIAFKTGNLNLVEDYLAHFIKTNNNIFKKIKKWDFANSFKARLYVVDFILTILCRRYILKCDGEIPHILDFELVRVNSPLLDVGRIIMSYCFEYDCIN